VASAMSGVSLFVQRVAQECATTSGVFWEFFKDGYEEDRLVQDWSGFTHLLTEDATAMENRGFRVVERIPGKPRLSLRERRIVTEDAIFVMERAE